MSLIFSPAIALMNRMRYPRKFALLGLVALVAIVFLQALLFVQLEKVIEPSRMELKGLAALKPFNRMIQAMQQHRGMSSGLLNGNESLRAPREERAKVVDKELAATEGVLPEAVKHGEGWRQLRKDWDEIKTSGLGWAPADNLKRHTRMLAGGLRVMVDLADATALTSDPDIDTHYLMDAVVIRMPSLLEYLGQMRGRGTGLLAKKEIDEEQKLSMGVLLGLIEATHVQQKSSLGKVMSYAPVTRAGLEAPMAEFDKSLLEASGLVSTDILGAAFGTDSAAYFQLTTALIDKGYGAMFGTLIPTMEQSIQQRIDAAEGRLYLTLALAIGVTVVFGWLAVGTYLSMVAGVRVLNDGAEQLAAGDLTGRVNCPSHDELADVASHFNHMAENMHSLLQTVRNTSNRLGETAAVVSASARTVAHSSDQQSEAATAMAAAVEELTSGINEISDHTDGAQQVSVEAQELSKEGGLTVEQTVAKMQNIAEIINESAAVIGDLGQHSHAISAIAGTIKEIADQTNLLALNAAIEAARAGEAGRGFAVVADEVRKLADRTTQSTQKITDMIGTIQQGTDGAVKSMQEGVARVKEGVNLSLNAGDAINRIREGSRRVQQNVSDIAGGLKEEAIASSEIAKNVERIAAMVEANSRAVNETANATVELEALASELLDEIKCFKV